ncbi:MAG TPA: sigma-70 family RNA polymerase sigma factor [bacterium]|nr:sigma-70 family RNA polymerase sigma factor [bacterium]HPP30335.1 sigma-70 family RNA polymerase sigma factor [bacterium]
MGKREEFELIVKEEMRRVFNLAYRLCGNHADAGDITQETFLRAYQSFDRFEGRSKVSTYLYRITCNVWKNKTRKRRIQNFTSYTFKLNKYEMEIPVFDDCNVEDNIKREERNKIVQDCINALAPADRVIIILRDMEGRSYEEIASILKCRTGTVKSRLARARQKLSEKILPLQEVLR